MSTLPELRSAAGALRVSDDVPAFGGERGRSALERETEIARAAGYAAGWTSGSQAAREAARIEHDARMAQINAQAQQDHLVLQQAAAALVAAAGRVEDSLSPDLAHIEDLILDTAMQVAQSIMGHDLQVTTTPGLDAVRRAMRLSLDQRLVRVRLSPTDAQTLENPVVRAEMGLPDTLVITADPGLQPGDSIAEFPDGSIESRLDAALDRTREVLGR